MNAKKNGWGTHRILLAFLCGVFSFSCVLAGNQPFPDNDTGSDAGRKYGKTKKNEEQRVTPIVDSSLLHFTGADNTVPDMKSIEKEEEAEASEQRGLVVD